MTDALATMLPPRRWTRWQGSVSCTAPTPGRSDDSPQVCGGEVDQATWCCTTCGRNATRGAYPGRCEDCGGRCTVIRQCLRAMTSCHCHLPPPTPEELAREAEREERLRLARVEAAERRMDEATRDMDRQEARACYEDPEREGRGGQARFCTEPADRLPFKFCRECPRVTGDNARRR